LEKRRRAERAERMVTAEYEAGDGEKAKQRAILWLERRAES
jgi:hypothetical protein